MVKTVNIPEDMQQRVASSIKLKGVKQTAAALGLNEKTVLKIAVGAPATAGTIAIVNAALRRLKKSKTPDNSGVQ